MFKKFIIVAVAIIGCMVNGKICAQDVQTAVLQHGDEMSVYYGAQAFVNALNNAVDGDDITLSAGTFKSADIYKAVSIHGAGYVIDEENNRRITVLDGDFTIDLPDEEVSCLLEGIYTSYSVRILNTNGLTINACSLYEIIFGKGASSHYYTDNCLISSSRIFSINYFYTTVQNLCLYNDIIVRLYPNHAGCTLHMDHCVVTETANNDSNGGLVYGHFTNSIIMYPTKNPQCSAYNNIVIGKEFKTLDQDKNILVSLEEANALFESSKLGNDADYRTMDFKLKNGDNSVGIYGGASPFTDVPGNPQILSSEIAPQSDVDGNLSVKIKVQTN